MIVSVDKHQLHLVESADERLGSCCIASSDNQENGAALRVEAVHVNARKAEVSRC